MPISQIKSTKILVVATLESGGLITNTSPACDSNCAVIAVYTAESTVKLAAVEVLTKYSNELIEPAHHRPELS